MHFFIDENISHHIAKALNSLTNLCDGNHTVVHAREFNGGYGVPDQVWLKRLKDEGNWIIISKDRFKKGDPERLAFEHCGLTTINLGKDWSRKKVWETAIRLIIWWPVISKQALQAPIPMHYELPWVQSSKLTGRKKP